MDRRIQKTKHAIMEALVELMSVKSFDQITIHEIAENANVNRGTVYLHYVDKYDLLDQCVESHLNQLFDSCMPGEDIADFTSKASLLRTFQYLERHAVLYKTMLTNRGTPAFRSRLHAKAVQSLNEQLDTSHIRGGMSKEVLVQFLASAAVGVLEWWIIRPAPDPAEDMVEQFWSLLELMQINRHSSE